MKKNSMATWRTTWYNQKTRSVRKRQQLWTHGKQLFKCSYSIMLCAYIPCTVTYVYSINYHPWLKVTDWSKISINATLKKNLTQSEERMFTCGFWERTCKLITSTLQLGNVSQAKQLWFCTKTMEFIGQSVYEKVSQLSNSLSAIYICQTTLKVFSASKTNSYILLFPQIEGINLDR